MHQSRQKSSFTEAVVIDSEKDQLWQQGRWTMPTQEVGLDLWKEPRP
jgi:hypothetical protein